ncbi:MAG: hypothetical protein Q8P44_07120 [Dehalococcoidia bacterium]|nr:hypothetical protein [Dehalococcoidia bacterium]
MNTNHNEPTRSCFYYWFVEPLKSGYEDNGSLQPAFSIPVETQFGKCELALFCDSEGQPDFIRLKIPGFAGEDIQEFKQEHVELLQTVKEHLVSILRLTYDSETEIARYAMWAFPEDGKQYSYGISIQELQGQRPAFPAVAVRNAFVGTWDKRTEIKLLTDALDKKIPLQYRYLSLYKILENHFKKHGKWLNDELDAFLSQFSVEFNKMSIQLSLVQYLHALRDKCAHIRTGKDILGVTQLSLGQAAEVGRFIPFFRNVCIVLLNSISDGKFTLKLLSEKHE